MSFTIIVWVTVVLLPAASVMLYVRVIVSGLLPPSVTSLSKATVGVLSQLSDSVVTTNMSAVGTSASHWTFVVAGLLAVGSSVSSTTTAALLLGSGSQASGSSSPTNTL